MYGVGGVVGDSEGEGAGLATARCPTRDTPAIHTSTKIMRMRPVRSNFDIGTLRVRHDGRVALAGRIVALRNVACTIYTDGGARGNPGPAAAAAVIVSDGGEVVELSAFLGTATNNVAEYQALLLALQRAKELGFRRISVRMDSELIVRQLNGLYRVKDLKMRELHQRARAAFRHFEDWNVRHVPRSENKRADELVNEELDAHALRETSNERR
jgi:ribonuclease HI